MWSLYLPPYCGAEVSSPSTPGLSCCWSLQSMILSSELWNLLTSHYVQSLLVFIISMADGATMEPWKSGELLVWMSLVLTPLLHHTSLNPQIGQESQVEKKTLKCGDIFKKAFLLFSSPGFETTGVLGPQVSVPEGSPALEISAPTSIYYDVSLWLYK